MTMKTQQTRSMLMKKQKQSIFPFFVKICRQKSFHWDIHKKKQHAGITHTTTQTVKYIIKMNVIAFDQSGLINHATQNKKFLRRPRISSLNGKGRHFLSFTEDRVFDLPFKFSSSLPHGLSVFAVLNQKQMVLESSKWQIKIFSDWKWNLVDFATKRNRLFKG